MDALVNKIIPFSSVDGPGNRTAIFLQGCNFNCMYCHNPETIQTCIHCGACLKVCPTGAITRKPITGNIVYDPQICCGCDACIQNCPHGSSPKTRYMSAEQVMKQVRRNMPFIRGITVSGGECTRQRDFLVELFTMAKKESLNCLLDSNGSYDFRSDPELMTVTDGVMLDIKAFSGEEHRMIAGVSNEMVIQNAIYLAQEGKLPEIRTVVVPGLFDVQETVKCTVELLSCWQDCSPTRYKLISYRPMGVRREYQFLQSPSKDDMEELKKYVRSLGWKSVAVT